MKTQIVRFASSAVAAALLSFALMNHCEAQMKSFGENDSGQKSSKQSASKNQSFDELRVGNRLSGRLTQTSDVLPEDGSFINRYRISGQPGAGIVVDMISGDFDTYLIVQDLQGNWITTGDDVLGATDSRVFFEMPRSGEAWVLANSFSSGATGDYEIEVLDASNAPIPGLPSPTAARVGMETEGRFTQDTPEIHDGTRADMYLVETSGAPMLEVEMSARDFAPYLIVFSVTGEVIGQASSSGQGDTASIRFSTSGNAPLYVMANQVEEATGSYRVHIRADKGPEMPQGNDPDEKYAMVVGVADYPDGVGDLALVSNDVDAFEEMLVNDLGYDRDYVYMLEDHHATRDNILDGMSEFLGRAGPDGTATFYFSGHGTQTQGNVALGEPMDLENDGADEAFVAYDQLVIDDEIGFALRLLDAGHISAFVDSCHAGTAVRDGVNQTKFIKAEDAKSMMPQRYLTDDFDLDEMKARGHDLSTLDDRVAYYASSLHDELSWTAGNVNMSVYTFFLTETMPSFLGRTMSELDDYMSPRVVEYSRNNFGSVQTPNAEGNIGQFSLGEQLGVER